MSPRHQRPIRVMWVQSLPHSLCYTQICIQRQRNLGQRFSSIFSLNSGNIAIHQKYIYTQEELSTTQKRRQTYMESMIQLGSGG